MYNTSYNANNDTFFYLHPFLDLSSLSVSQFGMFSQKASLDGRPKVEKPRPAPADPSIRGQPTNPKFGAQKTNGYGPLNMTDSNAVCGRYLQKWGTVMTQWHLNHGIQQWGVEDEFLFQLGDF